MSRRAARTDPVQTQIVAALRAAGCSVLSLATLGAGVPDLLCARNRSMFLLEVKTPGAKPNALQREWHAAWRADVHIVSSVPMALAAVGAM